MNEQKEKNMKKKLIETEPRKKFFFTLTVHMTGKPFVNIMEA